MTYVVEADSFEEAREKLCNREIFTHHTDDTFGPDVEYIEGVEVDPDEFNHDGDPAPTGRPLVRRDWEYDSVCRECDEPLTYQEETEDSTGVCGECREPAKA